ncbi:hypothetical protein B0T20DRAFT_46975 [Sordaria brevicollis]|uniref:Uncharacterized protein n=1 Tax=Sordaria brevicollis TaxID=83679 RepID=A0AAE0P9P8_SORBR|nr:hypothetical protein B0T20DRAFT_46975 [Sordaria brevicollis]
MPLRLRHHHTRPTPDDLNTLYASNSINNDTRGEEFSNMSAGKDSEQSNGQASSPEVLVSAALGDQFAQQQHHLTVTKASNLRSSLRLRFSPIPCLNIVLPGLSPVSFE